MSKEIHASTVIVREEENSICEFCGEKTLKPKVFLIPMLEDYTGEGKQFHLLCALKLLTLIINNRPKLADSIPFDWLVLREQWRMKLD